MSSKFHEQIVLVMGFLGGFALTALVLVLANQNVLSASLANRFGGSSNPNAGFLSEVYFKTLVGVLSGVSIFSIFGSFVSAVVASNVEWEGGWMDRFGKTLFVISIGSGLAFFPMYLYTFSNYWWLPLAIEVVLVVAFLLALRFGRRIVAATPSTSQCRT